MADLNEEAVRQAVIARVGKGPGQISVPKLAAKTKNPKVGVNTIYDFIKGKSSPKSKSLFSMANALELSETEMFGLPSPPTTSETLEVTAVIGPLARAVRLNGREYSGGSMYKVEPPVGLTVPEECEAWVMEGHSMRPMLFDGWLVVYRKVKEGVAPECLGQPCVAELDDGSLVIRLVLEASEPGRYNLEATSQTADTIYGARVKWASPILVIAPRKRPPQ